MAAARRGTESRQVAEMSREMASVYGMLICRNSPGGQRWPRTATRPDREHGRRGHLLPPVRRQRFLSETLCCAGSAVSRRTVKVVELRTVVTAGGVSEREMPPIRYVRGAP